MAYLGVVGTSSRNATLVWSRYVIAAAVLGYIVGQFATNGGYVYVG